MTFLAGALATMLVLMSAVFLRDLHDATWARMRAQTAADAAALAAVAEAAPYGVGAPEAAARTYAEANGARLLSCECEAGAVAAQVRVAYGGIAATARAEFDPRRLQPLVGPSTAGLDPALAAAVARLIGATRGAVTLVSGYRPHRRQEELWRQALATYGSAEAADDWVAPPGSSMHEKGMAVDLGGDLELARRLIDELGLPLHRPLPHEPWHFELLGSPHREGVL